MTAELAVGTFAVVVALLVVAAVAVAATAQVRVVLGAGAGARAAARGEGSHQVADTAARVGGAGSVVSTSAGEPATATAGEFLVRVRVQRRVVLPLPGHPGVLVTASAVALRELDGSTGTGGAGG